MKWVFATLLPVSVLGLVLVLRAQTPKSASVKNNALSLPPCSGCNLILISADTLRWDAVDWTPDGATPNLARLAQKSLRFTRAYANAFYTTPSHMTLFTSLYPNRHRVTGSEIHITGFERTHTGTPPLSPRYRTWAEVMKEAGYRTHWYGPLTLKHLSLELGFDRGFDKTSPTLFARPGRYADNTGFAQSTYARELRDSPRPFFHFLHSYITHLPYFAPLADEEFQGLFHRDRLARAYSKRTTSPPLLVPPVVDADRFDVFLHSLGQFQLRMLEGAREMLISDSETDRQTRALAKGYALAVRELDRQIGQVLDTIGPSGRTLIVFFSDHGEELFDHGRASHSTFYEHTARIPLIIYHPDLAEGRTFNGLVSLIDLMPTLLSTLQIPSPPQAQGSDLRKGANEMVFGFSLGSNYVLDGEWKVIRNARGQDELYNLTVDPTEQKDLAQSWWPPTTRAKKRLSEARSRWEMEQSL